ncbi:hypothetical protein F2Q69_00046094 [Brassica cretica]|uniref:Uncharacterized protein n=1 Tax=Brassica cretica TaxID=69181 RepID=A0A8S9PTL6_BRACR|nr:hypothetical protein F2Q69_00046094 [Brassica cretica]
MKWVRYGLRETASKGRRECMDSCRIDVSEEFGCYVATERNARSVTTCFAMLQGFSLSPAFEKRSCLTTDVRSQNCCSCLDANNLICDRGIRTEIAKGDVGQGLDHVCKLAGFLKTLEYWQRDKFWDLVSRFLILCLEMLETSALGLGQDLGLLLVLEGAMTNSTYVSRFSFILIPYRFKVRDRDVFTQIAKDVVGQGLDHGTLTFKVIRNPRGLLNNQCGISGGMTAFSDVTEGKERQKPASRRAKK